MKHCILKQDYPIIQILDWNPKIKLNCVEIIYENSRYLIFTLMMNIFFGGTIDLCC